MITRKPKTRHSTRIKWPYTPEPSPPLKATTIEIPIEDVLMMPVDNDSKSRPISVVSKREGIISPGGRPTLDDVLHNKAPAPYTLAAYTAFLSQQHCLETLEFVTEARKYSAKYDESTTTLCGMPLTTESSEGFELMLDWTRLLDVYVKPGAPREINLPSEERDDLVDQPYEPKPPKPDCLDPAVKRMYDLMSDSIFIPFCNSMKAVSHAQTYHALSELAHAGDGRETSHSMFNDRVVSHQRPTSGRRRSPPSTSAFQPSRSPPNQQPRSSALTSALNRTSSARLSTHVSNSSAASEGALSDESTSVGSPGGADLDSTLSPPLTPPSNELPLSTKTSNSSSGHTHQPPKPSRGDSGGWKKMGMKIFGQKKKGPSH